jgi:uncharacterized protein
LRRQQAERQQAAQRRAHAWELARQAAEKLKTEFGIERVMVFGSLTQADRFTQWSDIDLAAWGLTDRNWLKAMGAARYLGEVPINVVDVGCCAESRLMIVKLEGGEL